MDNMSETMVLKRKRSPTPQDWINPSEQLDEPTSPSSSTDEVCCELTKPKKKKKKQVKFNGVTVYYFQRSQGFTCVPSQGGSTLGMEHIHDFKENYSLNAFALEQDRQHRELLKEQLLERKQRQMLEQNDPELLNKSIQEIAENELAKINVDEYYFLQPVTTKRRRLMLRSAGVHKIESWEKSELKKIRLSREKCGCDCKIVCNPSTCACNLAGIKCQVDRLSFPCGCSKDGCGNTTGRVEFNPIKVRTHFLHTLMRLEVENGQNIETTVNRTDCNNDTNYTKLENSICLDESSDRVLDHGQCKECDSIPYTDYNDQYTGEQYTGDQYLNGQNTTKEYTHQLSSYSMSATNNFSCSNTDIPLDLQSQTNSSQQLPCVYDGESKQITLNSSTNSCNVPQPVISEYDSSTSEESATSESDSEPPYINPNISLENTGFSTSTDNVEKNILQTPDSSPDQQYTKLMPLDLSHALDDYETCEDTPTYDTPTYMQLSSRISPQLSSQTPQDGFCSDNTIINHHASLYTDYDRSVCNHLPYSTNMCKLEKTCTQNLTSQDQLNEYNMDSSHHSIATESNSTLTPLNHIESSLYVDEPTIEYFHESSQNHQHDGGNVINVACPYVQSEQYKTENKSHPSNDKYLVNQEIKDIYLSSNERIDNQSAVNNQLNTSELLLQPSAVKDFTQAVEAERHLKNKIVVMSSANESVGKHPTCHELLPQEEYLGHDHVATQSHNIQTERKGFSLDNKGCSLSGRTNSQLHLGETCCQFLPEIKLLSRNEELLKDKIDEAKFEDGNKVNCDKESEIEKETWMENVTEMVKCIGKTEKRDEKENGTEMCDKEYKKCNKENVTDVFEDTNKTEEESDKKENGTEEMRDKEYKKCNKEILTEEFKAIDRTEEEKNEKENVTKGVEENNRTEEEYEKKVTKAVQDINKIKERDEKENVTEEVEGNRNEDEKENITDIGSKEYEAYVEDSKKQNMTEEKWDTGLEELISADTNFEASIEIAIEKQTVEVQSNGILAKYDSDNCQFEDGCLSSNTSPVNQSSSGELSLSTEIKCCKNVYYNEAIQQSPASNTLKSGNKEELVCMLPSGPSSNEEELVCMLPSGPSSNEEELACMLPSGPSRISNCFSGICSDTATSIDGINTISRGQLTTNINDSHSPLVIEKNHNFKNHVSGTILDSM